MPPKVPRHHSLNYAGSETSPNHAPTTDRYDSRREERNRDPASDSIPRTITYGHSEKRYHRETVDDLGSDDLDYDNGSERRRRDSPRSQVTDIARDPSDRHKQRNNASYTHDIYEVSKEKQHFALTYRDGPGGRNQQPVHNVQGTKLETTHGDVAGSNNVQPPGRHPRVTAALPAASSTEGSEQICLSQVAYLFTRIGVIDFKDCRKFIQEQPAILKEDERHFRCQAALAYNAGDKQHARACVHRSLMINKCSKLDAGELEEYLRHLNGESKSAIKHFMNDFDGAYDHMKANLDLLIAAGFKLLQQVTPRTQTVQQTPADEQLSTSARRPSTYSRHRTSHSDVNEGFRNLNIQAGADDRNQAPIVTEPNSDRHNRRQGGSGYQGSHASVGPGEYTYRGTHGEVDALDSRYKRQKDPARFFCVGKVFAILWHENVGQSDRQPGPDVITSEGRFGERIFSHIRRMIVIRDRYGYCWCVGINTYGRRGIAAKRMSLNEAQAHTIAHASWDEPLKLDGEDAIVKEPIAIDLIPGHTLEVASRLNFAKVFTVEHNVKVMPLGKVAQCSLPYLQAYWANESAS